MSILSPDSVVISNSFQKKVYEADWNGDLDSVLPNIVQDSSLGAGNPLTFNTQPQASNHFINYAESVLQIPVLISAAGAMLGSTGTYNANGVVWKGSSLSFIFGLNISSTSNGNLLFSENCTAYVNCIKTLLDTQYSLHSQQEIMHFFGAQRNTGSQAVFGSINQGTAAPSYWGTAANPTMLLSGICMYQQMSSPQGTSSYVNVFLKLGTIHNFFAKLNRPLFNFGLNIAITFSGSGAGATFFPLVVESHSTAGAVTVVNQANGYTAINGNQGVGSAKLILKVCNMNDADLAEYNKMLDRGERQQIEFTVSEIYTYRNELSNTSLSVNRQIVQGITCPVRVHLLSCPNSNNENSSTTLFPAQCNVGLAGCKPYALNLSVNGTPQWPTTIATSYEIYEMIQSLSPQFKATSSVSEPLSYSDFLNGSLPISLDLSRMKIAGVNTPCSLIWTMNLTTSPSASTDLIFIVERVMTLNLEFSRNGISSYCNQGRVLD